MEKAASNAMNEKKNALLMRCKECESNIYKWDTEGVAECGETKRSEIAAINLLADLLDMEGDYLTAKGVEYVGERIGWSEAWIQEKLEEDSETDEDKEQVQC